MRNWNIHAPEVQEIAVLLFPRFSNHCLANAIEPLRAANELLRRDFYRWTYVTLDGQAVQSSSGLPVLPEMQLRDHPGGAHLMVMASYDVRRFATAQTARALSAAARRFGSVQGYDTGAWLMAHAGLLDGRHATIHWDEFAAFSEAFPSVEVVPDRFAIDQNRITCGGAMTAFDLTLELLRQTHGEALRLEVSAFFLHQATAPPEVQVYGQGVSAVVERGIALMSGALENPMPISQIAKAAGVSQRVLNRAFRAELGAAPMTVYKKLRLSAARRYAQQSGYSIAEIAVRCGYANASAMTRAFVEEYGQPPSAFRAAGQAISGGAQARNWPPPQ